MRNQVAAKTMPAGKKVYEHLKTSILSGAVNPRERLTEEHLAELLGVSRTPVREALHRLASEGLIRPLETRGFIVSGDSKEEVEELFEIRAVLEGYALRVTSEKISDDSLQCMAVPISPCIPQNINWIGSTCRIWQVLCQSRNCLILEACQG